MSEVKSRLREIRLSIDWTEWCDGERLGFKFKDAKNKSYQKIFLLERNMIIELLKI